MKTKTTAFVLSAQSPVLDDADLLERILSERELNALPTPSRTSPTRMVFPAVGELADAKVAGLLERIESVLATDGPKPHTREELDSLEQQLTAHCVRLQAFQDYLEADPAFLTKSRGEQRAALDAEATRLRKVQEEAWRVALAATHAQREGICTIAAMLDLSLCDGKAAKLFWVNVDPFATPATKARNEPSFRDLPDDQKVGHAWPLIEAAVDVDENELPVTLVPMTDKLVFQTAGRVVVLGGDAPGLLDLEWWADKLTKAGAVGFASVNRKDLGEGPFKVPDPRSREEGTAVRLRRKYSSENEATKSLTVCGNHPVSHPAQGAEEKPVCVSPGAVYAGNLYGNEYGRSDRSAVSPPTNPGRDRLVPGNWFRSLLVPSLRDRKSELDALPMAILCEVSNRRLDDINVVFSSSRTMYAGAEHPLEVELGTNLARAIVMHQVLMAKGTELTDENAQAIGRDLNSVLAGLSSRTDLSLPFQHAGCDTTKCRVADQVKRKLNGEPILDAQGNPVLTGKKEIFLPVTVTLREGVENFAIAFCPAGQVEAKA
ncbi:MAG: hypothetical protein IPN34_17635 [Planctomycetes bacterium]|nr:hypothetical protein [Planctomycetota bacterium]